MQNYGKKNSSLKLKNGKFWNLYALRYQRSQSLHKIIIIYINDRLNKTYTFNLLIYQ